MLNPIIKSNLRRPIKIILLLIILLIASNLFISSISQFFIVNREIDNISDYYRSIGTINSKDIYNYNMRGAREVITGDPMVDFENGIRQTIGVIDGLYSHERHSPAVIISEGSYIEENIFIADIHGAHKARSADHIYQGTILITNVDEILAGIPNLIEGNSSYLLSQEHHIGFLSNSLITGEKFKYINDDVIDALFELESGKKYLFRVYTEHSLKDASLIKPLYENGPLYIELDDDGYIDWEDPQFEIIKKDMEIINENIISYDLIGTKDMTAMPEVQDSMKDYYLLDGRWLDKKDHMNQNHVVVIHEAIANMYDISIGDTLDIKMRDSEYGSALATEKDHLEWKNYYTSEAKPYEVVGIFESIVTPKSLYKNMYVPDSTIPVELGRYTKGVDEEIPIVYPHLYSFVLKDVEDESTFIEKYKEPLEEMGYELNFVINNAESFKEATIPVKRSSTISLVLFSVLLILIQGFVVYLYIDGHKLNYGIERALGIPAKVSGRHLIFPLIISGFIISVIGGYIGYENAMENAAELLADLADATERTMDSVLDIKFFILFIILSMIPFMGMLLLKLNQLKNSSVIDLINNNKKKIMKDKIGNKNFELEKATNTSTELEFEESTEEKIDLGEGISREEKNIDKDNQKTVVDRKKALRNFSFNHALRSKITSILLMVLAGIFVFSLLWMNYLTIRNNDLIENAYKENIITADIIVKEGGVSSAWAGSITGRHIDNLFETDLVQDYRDIAEMFYAGLYIDRDGVIEKYEAGEKDTIHFLTRKPILRVYSSNKSFNSDDGLIGFTELNFLEGYSLDDFHKEYTGDYSNHLNPIIVNDKGEEGFPILVSDKAMEHFGLELGNKIFLEPDSSYRTLSLEAYGTIVGTFKILNEDRGYGSRKVYQEEDLFIYPISALETIERELYYSKLGFIFNTDKNKEILSRKDELRRMVANNPFNDYPTELNIWDGELTNVVEPLEKNLSLLEILYPITFILSVVLAGILSFMMVLRRSIDVAILRILGVKSKEVRWNLFRENIVLVLIGIILGCWLIIGITVNTYPIGIDKYVAVMGGYLLGTAVGLILGIGKVTNKKPLDMLQVKE